MKSAKWEKFLGAMSLKRHRILHMASFSRSGETLMLRCLNAHPKIHVVHQILEPEPPENSSLYRRLKKSKQLTIPAETPHIQAAKVANGAALILKNATWTHPWDFKGFVLVRNPLSIVNSLKMAYPTKSGKPRRHLHLNRWTQQIAPSLLDEYPGKSPVEKMALLYEAKMLKLATCGLPIVRYEDFVQHPEVVLRRLLKSLGIPWNDSVLRSHQSYREGQLGHGKMPLWKPINAGSLDSWKHQPSEVIDSVLRINAGSMKAFGYEFHDGDIVLREDIPNLISRSAEQTFFEKLTAFAKRG